MGFKGANTGSIGISVCCMAKAEKKPFKAGKFPMTQVQWAKMAEVAADLEHVQGSSIQAGIPA